MTHQEKKYRVTSFADITKKLDALGAKRSNEVITTHYYGKPAKADVEKIVAYADHTEIHIVKRPQGKIVLTDPLPISDTSAGFLWLKERGYTGADVVKMAYTEYGYKDGTVGLYTIDDFLYSVILAFPDNHVNEVTKELGLETAEPIHELYNGYLAKLGRLRSIKL